MCDNQKYVKELIPELVDAVYYKLLRYNITARVFSTHDSRDENDPEVWLRKGDAQINNRKIFLRWYFIRLISWAGEMNYWEYLDKVGYVLLGLSLSASALNQMIACCILAKVNSKEYSLTTSCSVLAWDSSTDL